jgi:cold shock CspA family protein
MVLSWDFEYTNDFGKKMTTRTSQELLEEVTYPVAMHEVIDNRVRKNEPLINGLFVPRNTEKVFTKQKSNFSVPQNNQGTIQNKTTEAKSKPTDSEKPIISENGRQISTIFSLKEGFGFIKGENSAKNVFFFHSSLVEYDFNDLEVGDKVEFVLETQEDGRLVGKEIKVIE